MSRQTCPGCGTFHSSAAYIYGNQCTDCPPTTGPAVPESEGYQQPTRKTATNLKAEPAVQRAIERLDEYYSQPAWQQTMSPGRKKRRRRAQQRCRA